MTRGRPRKFNVDRYANGKTKDEQVLPTPELVARRTFLAGNGDPALTTTALGILRAAEIITDDQQRAAEEYARHYRTLYGHGGPAQAQHEGRAYEGDISESRDKALRWAKERFDTGRDMFAGRPRADRDAFDNLVIHGRRPSWFVFSVACRPRIPTRADVAASEMFLLDIAQLVTLYTQAKKKIAA